MLAEMRRELERMSNVWSEAVDACSGKPTEEQWDLIHKHMKKDVGRILDRHSVNILSVVRVSDGDGNDEVAYEDGRRDGYDEGFSDGRDDGFSAGLNSGREEMMRKIRILTEELANAKKQLSELRASHADG
jgi:hypothetical protein